MCLLPIDSPELAMAFCRHVDSSDVCRDVVFAEVPAGVEVVQRSNRLPLSARGRAVTDRSGNLVPVDQSPAT